MGRDKEYPLSPELEANLKDLLEKVNKLRQLYGKPMYVSSGYRPGSYNTAAGGAKMSNHTICKAVDFKDPNGDIDAWCLQNMDKLKEIGLWLEHPDSTKGWCHVDTKPRKNNPFKP